MNQYNNNVVHFFFRVDQTNRLFQIFSFKDRDYFLSPFRLYRSGVGIIKVYNCYCEHIKEHINVFPKCLNILFLNIVRIKNYIPIHLFLKSVNVSSNHIYALEKLVH